MDKKRGPPTHDYYLGSETWTHIGVQLNDGYVKLTKLEWRKLRALLAKYDLGATTDDDFKGLSPNLNRVVSDWFVGLSTNLSTP